ncbi:MAG: hypothetical protein H6805_05335 [Planctomycetes bacterium]|nr:hypothetical protein [Planctomycetota bacterium]
MNERDISQEAHIQVQQLIHHRGSLVAQTREALAEVESAGATTWRARYALARELKEHCRVRGNSDRHARAQLCLCLLRAYEGWPDRDPTPRGERGRVSTIQMNVYSAADAIDPELGSFAMDLATDTTDTNAEVEARVEQFSRELGLSD